MLSWTSWSPWCYRPHHDLLARLIHPNAHNIHCTVLELNPNILIKRSCNNKLWSQADFLLLHLSFSAGCYMCSSHPPRAGVCVAVWVTDKSALSESMVCCIDWYIDSQLGDPHHTFSIYRLFTQLLRTVSAQLQGMDMGQVILTHWFLSFVDLLKVILVAWSHCIVIPPDQGKLVKPCFL